MPVKRFAVAKRRLSPVLGAAERARLARLMLEDVLNALARCEVHLAGTVVVTADEDAAALAERRNAIVVSDGGRDGINAAIRLGLDWVTEHGGAGRAGRSSTSRTFTQCRRASRRCDPHFRFARRRSSNRRRRHQSARMPSGERASAGVSAHTVSTNTATPGARKA